MLAHPLVPTTHTLTVSYRPLYIIWYLVRFGDTSRFCKGDLEVPAASQYQGSPGLPDSRSGRIQAS